MMSNLEFLCLIVSEQLSLKRESNTKLFVALPVIVKYKMNFSLEMMLVKSSERAINRVSMAIAHF